MSNYGPPGGPYPGQPSQPWPDRQPSEPYSQPSDPWAGQDPWGGTPASTPPDAPAPPFDYGGYHRPDYSGYDANQRYESGYPPGHPGPVWGGPGGPPPKRGKGPLIAVAVTLAVLVAGVGATVAYLISRPRPTTTSQQTTPTTDPTTNPTPTSSPTPTPAGPEATTPVPQSSTDARFVKAGQCVKNDGSDAKPELVITKCADEAYQVLVRIDGSTTGDSDAKAKCSKVKDYTNYYYFNSELDALDFVLCLKRV